MLLCSPERRRTSLGSMADVLGHEARRRERDGAALVGREPLAAPHGLDGGEREARRRGGAVEEARARPAAHARQRIGQQLVLVGALFDGEGKGISLPLAATQLDIDRRQQEHVAGAPGPGTPGLHDGVIDEAGRLDARALAGEPALRGEEARRRRFLEGEALAALEQGLGTAREHEREELGLRTRPEALLARGRRGQLEPIEAVGRQRQEIGQVADRREGGAAGHLDERRAIEFREVELNGLRRARHVGDAQDALAVILAEIREHLAVGRIQEAQGAASEGACGCGGWRPCGASS